MWQIVSEWGHAALLTQIVVQLKVKITLQCDASEFIIPQAWVKLSTKVNFGHKKLFKSTISAFIKATKCASCLILKLNKKRRWNKAEITIVQLNKKRRWNKAEITIVQIKETWNLDYICSEHYSEELKKY